MKIFQIVIGAVIVVLGLMSLVVVLRADPGTGGGGQAIIGPLSLIGVGALAISAARRRKK